MVENQFRVSVRFAVGQPAFYTEPPALLVAHGIIHRLDSEPPREFRKLEISITMEP
jgi:hypothetical protein